MTVLHVQLMALRAACEAVIYAIDAFLAHSQQTKSPAQAPASDGCPHPQGLTRPAPAMGTPNRWYCGMCNEHFDRDPATGEVKPNA